MLLFEKKNSKGEVTATNIPQGVDEGRFKRRYFKTSDGNLKLLTDESSLLKSSKIFKKVGGACAEAFDLFYKNFAEQLIAHSHSIKKIQGQMIQKIDGVLHSAEFQKAESYQKLKEVVLNNIKEAPEEIADALIYIEKRAFEIGAHMTSFELIHMKKDLDLDFQNHNIVRILANIWHAFEETAQENNITCRFKIDESISETSLARLDYKTINAAFYNLLDNSVKYAKPYSELRFYISTTEDDRFLVMLTTKSLRIDQDEINEVFKLGYRGKYCKDEEGSGVGMYVVKKALNLNKLEIEISPDYSKMEEIEGRQYILNKFSISGSLQKN